MSQIRILIVDDAKFIRERVSKVVKEAFPEFLVDAAEHGQDAVTLMEKNQYELLLCDWEMPEMSGLEVLQWVRAQELHKATPFVMVTSRGERDFVLKAIQSGVNDYLGKPFNSEQLIQKIVKQLARTNKLSDELKQRVAKYLKADSNGKPAAKSAPAASSNGAAKSIAKPKGLAQLRTSDGGIFKCAIKDMSLQEVMIVVKNDGGAVPQVLDQVVVDIEQLSGDSVARMNAFVQMVQATERKLDSTYLNVKVIFMDDDPQKMEELAKYIASVR